MILTREISQYIQYLKGRRYSKRTIESYEQCLKQFQKYLVEIDLRDLKDLRRPEIFSYQMRLINRQPAVSAQTQCHHLGVLRGFFKYLVKTNRLLSNPAGEIEFPKTKQKLPFGIISLKEVKRLLKQPDVDDRLGLRDRAIIELLYATGIRNQELRHLHLTDIDFKEQTILIHEGKGGKDRLLPLGKAACNWIMKYIQTSRPSLLSTPDEKTLFLSYQKKPFCRYTLSYIVQQYGKAAGIQKKITPHGLRHTCATHMLKNNASIRHIQALLGHKSLETTQRYTRVEISDLKRAHRKYHPRENQAE